MNKSRFVNESSSKLKNVNASIVVNTMIDFDFLWKIKLFWLYYNITFKMRKCARWFFYWSTTTFKTSTSSLYKSLDEIFSYWSRWTSIKVIFIYFTNLKRTRKCVSTSMTSWTRIIETLNILQLTYAYWK
jgi:hypothetical protein